MKPHNWNILSWAPELSVEGEKNKPYSPLLKSIHCVLVIQGETRMQTFPFTIQSLLSDMAREFCLVSTAQRSVFSFPKCMHPKSFPLPLVVFPGDLFQLLSDPDEFSLLSYKQRLHKSPGIWQFEVLLSAKVLPCPLQCNKPEQDVWIFLESGTSHSLAPWSLHTVDVEI